MAVLSILPRSHGGTSAFNRIPVKKYEKNLVNFQILAYTLIYISKKQERDTLWN